VAWIITVYIPGMNCSANKPALYQHRYAVGCTVRCTGVLFNSSCPSCAFSDSSLSLVNFCCRLVIAGLDSRLSSRQYFVWSWMRRLVNAELQHSEFINFLLDWGVWWASSSGGLSGPHYLPATVWKNSTEKLDMQFVTCWFVGQVIIYMPVTVAAR
jgi:hypothetical protein